MTPPPDLRRRWAPSAWTLTLSWMLFPAFLTSLSCDVLLVDPVPVESGQQVQLAFTQASASMSRRSPWHDVMAKVGRIRLRLVRAGQTREAILRGRFEDGELRTNLILDPAEADGPTEVYAELGLADGAPLFKGRGKIQDIGGVASSVPIEITPVLAAFARGGGRQVGVFAMDGSIVTEEALPGVGFRVDASPVDQSMVLHGMSRIFIVDPFNGGTRRITPPDTDQVLAEEQWARFSADGEWIYFMGRTVATGYWELWRARTDGSVAERLPQEQRRFNGYPSLSHAGDRLVYSASSRFNPGVSGVLEVLDLNTFETTSLDVSGGTSRWSPDDDWIAYTNQGDEMHLVRPDGTRDFELAPGTAFGPGFDWSPDGGFIIATNPQGEGLLVAVPAGTVATVPDLGILESVAFYGP